ncbi:MAG: SH3 domain-containing protein [bacterium]|nr:SH3 domain-containing protein [bacterium]
MTKRTILIIVLAILILGVVGMTLKETILKPAVAGIQVKSNPQSTVFLDGKNIGQTPFEDKKLTAGEVELKLIPNSATIALSPWTTKIKLVAGAQTIINWDFGEDGSFSAGEIMTLEKIPDKKTASLAIISTPDSSLVKIDGEPKGFTPVSFDKQEANDRRVSITSTGYIDRDVNIKLLSGYKLVLNVKLATQLPEPTPTLTPTPTPTPSGKPSKTTPTPTPKTSATPTPKSGTPAPKATPSPVSLPRPYVTITETPTGYLNVRSDSSTGSTSTILTKVYPGESYALVDQTTNGWYKITYAAGKEGWISGQYAQKFE